MNFFRASLAYATKRPFLLIYMAGLSLLYAILQFLNPLNTIMKGFDQVISSSWTETLMVLSKEVYKLSVFPYVLIALFLLAVVCAVLSSVIGAGYMNALYHAVRNRKTTGKTFFEGIRKYFLRSLLIFFELYVVLFAFLALVPLTMVPAIVISDRAVLNGSTNFFTSSMFPAITGMVLFIALLFLMNWFAFRLPANYYFTVKPIEKAKTVLSAFYWRSFAKNAVFLFIFIIGIYMIFSIKNPVAEFFASFGFLTLFFYLYSVFTFFTFSEMVEFYKN